MENSTEKCLVCERSKNEIPLMPIAFQDGTYWICPSHLPVLIHRPHELIGKLPGVENLEGHAH